MSFKTVAVAAAVRLPCPSCTCASHRGLAESPIQPLWALGPGLEEDPRGTPAAPGPVARAPRQVTVELRLMRKGHIVFASDEDVEERLMRRPNDEPQMLHYSTTTAHLYKDT